ncbi:MAG: hypothetical protein FJW38_06540 [Acidobacteria bacterium]|nr:hypothetical protein [Acidobacteriota bacterium]
MFRKTLFAAAVACAADWPAFRGPNGSGLAAGNPPVEFGPSKNVGWKVSPPQGKSSPVIVGDKLFLTGHNGEALLTVAYDTATGKEQWRRELKRRNTQKRHKLNDAAAPTAVADAKRVVVFFSEYGLAAYGHDGKELWTIPMDSFASMQGVSTSPVLHNDSVYLVVDQTRDSFVMAVNAANGEVRWKKKRPDASMGVYSSPVIFSRGVEPVLGVIGDLEFTAYSLKTGERVWWVHGLPNQAKTSPSVNGDRIILAVNSAAEASAVPAFATVLETDANGNKMIEFDESKGLARGIFAVIDRNGDKIINEAEWTAFREKATKPATTMSLRPRGRGNLTNSAIEWMIQRAVPNVPSPLVASRYSTPFETAASPVSMTWLRARLATSSVCRMRWAIITPRRSRARSTCSWLRWKARSRY